MVLGDQKIGSGMSGGALQTLTDYYTMHGQPPDTVHEYITVRAKGYDHPEADTIKGSGLSAGGLSAGGISGGARGARNDIVKKIMKEQGLSLPLASKFVKEHNLYKKS
jgi:hypothetical protein